MEAVLIFPVRHSPDPALAHIGRRLRQQGYTTEAGTSYDLVGKRALDRVFVGIGAHPRGLAARIKAKSLVPGRTGRLHSNLVDLVQERLGAPTGHLTDWDLGGPG